ncbi:MAG: ECF transporter S component [Clostridia bacterium]|nr:ECF transporter S component [Clostridia bacterium]
MSNNRIKKLSAVAMFCALAFALTYVKIPVLFLSLEIKDSIIVLCTLLFGPISGLFIAVLVPFLEMVTHSSTGVYGFVMNMLSSVTFSMVTGLIYKYKKSFYGAIVGLLSGVFAVTAVMVLANLLITPYYMGVPVQEVAALIPKVLLPFNFIKATLNGAIVLLLYKPLSNVLKRTGFFAKKQATEIQVPTAKNTARSIVVTVIAALVIIISLVIIFFVLK